MRGAIRNSFCVLCAALLVGASLAGCAKAPTKPAAEFLWAATGGPAERMRKVTAVARAPDGKIWVADASSRFFIFDSEGRFIETWGSPGGGPGQFNFYSQRPPYNSADILFFPDGSFYVADFLNSRVQRFDAERRYLGEWRSVDGNYSPTGLCRTAKGEILVGYLQMPALERYDASGRFLGKLELGLDAPLGLASDEGGRVYAVEYRKNKVRIFEAGGAELEELGAGESSFGGMSSPGGIALDGEGRVYVADQGNSRVLVFDGEGKYLFSWGGPGVDAGQFRYASSVALDGEGDAYVGDTNGGRLEKFALRGLPRLAKRP